MARIYMASTEFGRLRSPNAWVEVQQHLIRGDEVVVTHYRKRVALIKAYSDEDEENFQDLT